MSATTIARRVTALERKPDFVPFKMTLALLALARLNGALDAARRSGLTEANMAALADRIKADKIGKADPLLFAAFHAGDLKAAKTTAQAVMTMAADVWRYAAMPRNARDSDADSIRAAADVIRKAGEVLAQRLRLLPDFDELERLGNAFELGTVSAADIVVIRAVPGPWLAANSNRKHYAIFADYRLWDY